MFLSTTEEKISNFFSYVQIITHFPQQILKSQITNLTKDKYFTSIAEELIAKVRRINSIHPDIGKMQKTAIGDWHEYVLRDTLERFLPSRFSVKTGYILGDNGENLSPQIDLMIIDETNPTAYIIKFGDFAIVFSDAVCATIEIKTNLKGETELREIADHTRRLRAKMNSQSFLFDSFTFVFDSDYTLKTSQKQFSELFKNCEVEPIPKEIEYPTAVYLQEVDTDTEQKPALLLLQGTTSNNAGIGCGDQGEFGHVVVGSQSQGQSLSCFFNLVFRSIEKRGGNNRTAKDKFPFPPITIRFPRMQFGKGIVEDI